MEPCTVKSLERECRVREEFFGVSTEVVVEAYEHQKRVARVPRLEHFTWVQAAKRLRALRDEERASAAWTVPK